MPKFVIKSYFLMLFTVYFTNPRYHTFINCKLLKGEKNLQFAAFLDGKINFSEITFDGVQTKVCYCNHNVIDLIFIWR